MRDMVRYIYETGKSRLDNEAKRIKPRISGCPFLCLVITLIRVLK